MKPEPGRSWLGLRLVQAALFASLLLLAGALSSRTPAGATTEGFLRAATRTWCADHSNRADLQVVAIDVTYRAEPPLFSQGEGTVVAPVALDLPGGQRLLDVASEPPHLRKLTTPLVTSLAWEYAGRLHRGLRFRAIALVERPPRRSVTLPATPTFDQLPPDLRPESFAKAAALEEHSLEKCAGFAAWATKAAGAPPHTAQVERLVQAVSRRSTQKDEAEDLCAALRDGRFRPHWAQVAVVMGAREADVPAFGFAPASEARTYLVGTWVDGVGWVLLDLERPADGWFTGGPALVTMAPLLSGFDASQHGFWSPVAAAYGESGWGVQTISATEWQGDVAPGKRTDTTTAQAMPLEDVCR
jgi:hypothetical protein